MQKGKELEKNRSKAHEAATAFCSRLGCYRQLFAWAALPVFSRGSLLLQEQSTFVLYPAHFKDNIVDHLIELRDPKAKRGKAIPGQCDLRVTQLSTESSIPPFRLDPTLNPVRDPITKAIPSTDGGEETWVREVQEFSDGGGTCFWSYINNLYIYPESVVMSAHNRKVKVHSASSLDVLMAHFAIG